MSFVSETWKQRGPFVERITGSYDKEQPGLNHLAFGVGTPTALRELAQHLNSTGLRHSGIKVDHYGNKEFVWLDDPNGFRLEFYCRPTSPTS